MRTIDPSPKAAAAVVSVLVEIERTKRDISKCRANVKAHGGGGCDDVADAELDCTERHLAALQRILKAIQDA